MLAQRLRRSQCDPVATEHDAGKAGRNAGIIVCRPVQQHAAQGRHRIPYRDPMTLHQVQPMRASRCIGRGQHQRRALAEGGKDIVDGQIEMQR
jgi:hypothetical protein